MAGLAGDVSLPMRGSAWGLGAVSAVLLIGRNANGKSSSPLRSADLVRRSPVAVLGEREVVAVGILESQLHGTPRTLLNPPGRPSRFADPFEDVLD